VKPTERLKELKTVSESRVRRIAILGNYVPRQCGIATYTADVAVHLTGVKAGIEVLVVAMNDRDDYEYEAPVTSTISAGDRSGYARAAQELNEKGFDLVNVQHEFGIFGGVAGEYLLDFMRAVNMPIVTTLHTILRNPNPDQRRVFLEVLELSERVVTMTWKGLEILSEVYGVSRSKVDVVHHGIPDADPDLALEIRRVLKAKGPIILTFGLIGRDKGIHTMIEAMPRIIERAPGATYVVVGATHPHLRATEGEAYRESLQARVRELRLEDNVRFVNRFVPNEELAGWLGATDVYVTPYLKEEQITSGTLAYALGNGNAVVSTPFWHASELLAEDRGVLVPFGDVDAMADEIGDILTNFDRHDAMCAKAAAFGQEMRWPRVAERFMASFDRARQEGEERLRNIIVPERAILPVRATADMPKFTLDYLKTMTDDTGLLQHGIYQMPNRNEGYCTDDNARALILMLKAGAPRSLDRETNRLYATYLAFVVHAYDPDKHCFRNFMSYDRCWLESVGSDDSNARALWSLASVARLDPGANGDYARQIVSAAFPSLETSPHLRTWAFRLIAMNELDLCDTEMAERLLDRLKIHRSPEWYWFEEKLTYDNARLSQALILAGAVLGEPFLSDGLRSLQWLMEVQTGPKGGVFAAIGSDGFWTQGGDRAWFDQQPLEAWASVSACLTAARVTGDLKWELQAERAFHWFLGLNMTGTPLALTEIGACADGLEVDGVNMNCGAESTLSYLMSQLEINAYRKDKALMPREADHHNTQRIPNTLRTTS
jgi:glycosyltransferase involved in cell wall biosynthesis